MLTKATLRISENYASKTLHKLLSNNHAFHLTKAEDLYSSLGVSGEIVKPFSEDGNFIISTFLLISWFPESWIEDLCDDSVFVLFYYNICDI